MMFRTTWRLSDSLTRATGNVYRRALRQAFYASLVFLAAWFGKAWGVTGVALGVVGAITVNYLSMAHLSLGLLGSTWGRFAAGALTGLLAHAGGRRGDDAFGMGTRHLHLPALAGLLLGSIVALASAIMAVWLVPGLVLGVHGEYLMETLRVQVLPRLRRIGRRTA